MDQTADASAVDLVGWLAGARERLCRAQVHLDGPDGDLLQGALDRIDLVGCDMPGWSKYDGGRVRE